MCWCCGCRADWPPTIKDLEKLQYRGADGWAAAGVIRRDVGGMQQQQQQTGGSGTPAAGGAGAAYGIAAWPRKWFVLWPSPGAIKSEKDYPAKELREHGGRWLFQFDYTADGGGGGTAELPLAPPPLSVAEASIPITGVGVNALPSGDGMMVIELTPQEGQADKIRLVTESMEDFGSWVSAIGTMADYRD